VLEEVAQQSQEGRKEPVATMICGSRELLEVPVVRVATGCEFGNTRCESGCFTANLCCRIIVGPRVGDRITLMFFVCFVAAFLRGSQ